MNRFHSNASHVLIVDKETGRILLTKVRDSGRWVMPGGHLEIGETFRSAAIREVKEEASIKLKEISERLVLYSKAKNIQKKVYISYVSKDELKLSLSNETTGIRWFEINRLPKNMTLYEISRIKKTYGAKKLIKEELRVNYLAEVVHKILTIFS